MDCGCRGIYTEVQTAISKIRSSLCTTRKVLSNEPCSRVERVALNRWTQKHVRCFGRREGSEQGTSATRSCSLSVQRRKFCQNWISACRAKAWKDTTSSKLSKRQRICTIIFLCNDPCPRNEIDYFDQWSHYTLKSWGNHLILGSKFAAGP